MQKQIINTDEDYFYIFVIDISFPKNMHDTFEEFPLLVDKGIPPGNKTNKLMATLNDKKDYVISLHMLKFVLDKGYVLDETHAIIYAEQKAFMKLFIELR